ncbi:hypothetical protein AZE42_09330 [Rhizopogon vesiculosus]|uniref:Uncharacterized protein n=1 Tax=Rhizopogon vesiculosus TaxID=180088 RepID=A0A1J8QI66_9AGAM|nr:hypothetical protein AZE42_09330 [Rhizopogon vesiculosus]
MFARLSVKENLSIMQRFTSFSNAERSRKELLLQDVFERLNGAYSEEAKKQLATAIRLKQVAGLENRKRRSEEALYSVHKRSHLDELQSSPFLRLPTEQERKECHAKFIGATGRGALAQGVCGVCARECSVMDEGLTSWKLLDIPNGGRLIPTRVHPVHELYNGMLLEAAGITGSAEELSVAIRGRIDYKPRLPPRCILVKMNKIRADRLEGLKNSVIPIEPVTKTFRMMCTNKEPN